MFKKFLDNISNTLGIANNKISEIIKTSNRYINAEEKISKDIEQAVTALKSYAGTETPSLEQAINSLANTFEIIETERLDKVKKLRDEFVAPLNALVIDLKKLQTEQGEAEKAAKAQEKAEKQYNKVKNKPEEKVKPNELENAENKLKAAKEKLDKEEKDVKMTTETFNKAKLETMQKVLNTMVDVESTYHQKILDSITGVKEKVEAINIEEESKIQ
ncbi:MAG: BAR domain protein [Candidatus Lokiarchaeum sp. GC14_75]|nr:MAG: BAR domain protein [Candidatus Lokiarchaeum sp. GC14_75]